MSIDTEKTYDELLVEVTELRRQLAEAKNDAHSEHNHTHEREQLRLAETLINVTLALTSRISLDELLDEILHQAQILVPHKTANIALLEEDALQIKRWRGYEDDSFIAGLIQPLSDIPLDHDAIRAQKVLIIPDTQQEPLWVRYEETAWIRSYMLIPICTRNLALGTLRLDSEFPHQFSEADAGRLLPLASAAAIALENAHLYEMAQRDIAERKHIQRRLNELNHQLEERVNRRTAEFQQTKERLEAIFNSSADAMILAYVEDGIQQTNPAFDELFASRPDDYLGFALTSLFHTDDVAMLENAINNIVLDNRVVRLEVTACRKDNTTFPAEISLSPTPKRGIKQGIVSSLRDLTQRKLLEGAVRASETELRTLLGAMKDAIMVLDGEGRYVKIAPTNPELLYLPPYQLVGKRVDEIFPPEKAALFLSYIRNALAVRQTIYREYDLMIGGKLFWFYASITPISDNEVLMVARDITPRKLAEDKLRESEARLAEAQRIAKLGNWEFDYETHEFNWSDEIFSHYDLDPNQPIPSLEQQFAMLHPDDVEMFLTAFGQAMVNEAPVETEVRHLRADGSCRYVWVKAQPVFRDGKAVKLIGTSQDITERKLAEEARMRSEADLRSIFESAPLALILVDLDFNIRTANTIASNFAQKFYGRPLQPGDSVLAFSRINNEADIAQTYLRRAVNGESSTHVLKLVLNDDEHYVELAYTPVVTTAHKIIGVCLTAQDITQRKRAELKLREALEKQKELSALKTHFIAMASHEFRTPLATIQAANDAMRVYSGKMTDEQQQRRMEKINAQVRHMTHLLDDVLVLGSIQAGKIGFRPIKLDLIVFCHEIIEEVSHTDTGRHIMDFHAAESEVLIFADENLIRQIFTNLLTNAIKYSPAGSTIEITVTLVDDMVKVAIKDQGIGIPEKDRLHLFEPFHRGSNVGKVAGSGLGLAITKQAVELHRGLIDCVSIPNEGTTFTVTLPVCFEC